MKFAVSTGEVSGDMHAAHLVAELKILSPESTFFGVGGEQLQSLGVDIIANLSSKGSIGIIEAIPNLFSVYSIFLKMKSALLNEKPDALILVDTQGFNVPLAEYAKKIGIKTIYYIPPQEWLWGTRKGARKIAKSVDLIISIFKEEHEVYLEESANSFYFGHPLLDIIKLELSGRERGFLFNSSGKLLVCLCPGSRKHEVKNVFPSLIESAKLIQKHFPQAEFCVLVAAQWIKNDINKVLKKHNFSAALIESYKYDLLQKADIVLAASGTINLEASILGVKNIMVYSLHPLTYWIGKNILKVGEKIKYFSMPNILLNEPFIPEFIQDRADPRLISKKAIEMLEAHASAFDNSKLISLLGKPPVLSKIAEKVLSFTRN